MLKFWSLINYIVVHWTKKFTLVTFIVQELENSSTFFLEERIFRENWDQNNKHIIRIIVNPDQPHEPGWLGGELNGQVGWFPEAYAEPASNPVKVEKPAAVAEAKESNQYVALFPYNSEGLFMFYTYLKVS